MFSHCVRRLLLQLQDERGISARWIWARVNLQRTEIRSPVNGNVTNLLAQLGDYATVGENLISLVDAGSYWVDGYFEETNLHAIHKDEQRASNEVRQAALNAGMRTARSSPLAG